MCDCYAAWHMRRCKEGNFNSQNTAKKNVGGNSTRNKKTKPMWTNPIWNSPFNKIDWYRLQHWAKQTLLACLCAWSLLGKRKSHSWGKTLLLNRGSCILNQTIDHWSSKLTSVYTGWQQLSRFQTGVSSSCTQRYKVFEPGTGKAVALPLNYKRQCCVGLNMKGFHCVYITFKHTNTPTQHASFSLPVKYMCVFMCACVHRCECKHTQPDTCLRRRTTWCPSNYVKEAD